MDLCFGRAMLGCLRYACRPESFLSSLEDILCLDWDFSQGDLAQLPEGVQAAAEGLKARARAGEALRLWDNNTPFTRCGLLFTAHLLEEVPCDLLVLSLPESFGWWRSPPPCFPVLSSRP